MTPKALSRGIKFRAWNDSKKDWEGNFSISRIGSFLRLGISQSTEGIHVMQFTGLHDKNGKEIYEGDVVMLPNMYYDPSNGDNPMELIEVVYKKGVFVPLQDCDSEEMEVIGNIFENPSLLTKENK